MCAAECEDLRSSKGVTWRTALYNSLLANSRFRCVFFSPHWRADVLRRLRNGGKYVALSLKGGINLFGQAMTIWTATLSQADSKSAWKVDLSPIPNEFLSLVEVTKASCLKLIQTPHGKPH